jgi:hypothetical protein
MGKCTKCGAKAGAGFSVCDSCINAERTAKGTLKLKDSTALPRRSHTWIDTVLLVFGGLWAILKIVNVMSSYGMDFARELDFFHPSLLGIMGVSCFAVYFIRLITRHLN